MPSNEKMDRLARDAFPSARRKEVLRSLADHIKSMKREDPELRRQFNKNEPLLKQARGIRDHNYDTDGIVGQHLEALKECYKEYYKLILNEAILATNTSRQTQSRIRKVRGIDSPDRDHPIMNLQDPLNRSRLRNMTPEKAKAYQGALNTAMSAEFMPNNRK